MQRVLSTTALLGLLIATAAAFAITERLKLAKSPIYGTHVSSKFLSPTCGCARGKVRVGFSLRHGDHMTLTIRNAAGDVVRTLAQGGYVPRGAVSLTWDGRTDFGMRVPDGTYRPEVHLTSAHRTILLPNPIRVDTRPPKVISVNVSRAVISPDGDKVGDVIRLHYRFNSPAHVDVYLAGQRIIHSRSHQPQGTVSWLGKDATTRKPLPAGTYVLWVGGTDLAGNATPVADRQPVILQVRYIRIVRSSIVARSAGAPLTVGIDTDAATYWWKLGGRHGVATGDTLHVLAPKKPGVYRLAVGERSYTAHATVIVGKAK